MLWQERESEALCAFIIIRFMYNVNGNHVEQPNVISSGVFVKRFYCRLPLTTLF